MLRKSLLLIVVVLAVLAGAGTASDPQPFRFAILGDRTGEAQPDVYEHAWQQVAAENPAFVVAVGDTIQGQDDFTARPEWQAARRLLDPYRRFPLYLVAGNHDIWSPLSERLFREYAGHPPHYSFDYGQMHVTILDNSRSEELPPTELEFLEKDLEAHRDQPVKFIFSHRPSWLVRAALQDTSFPLHQLARKYGVQFVIAGHVHQMLHLQLQGVAYVSIPSSGGHLRASGQYADGWFFGHALVQVRGTDVDFRIEELPPPHGEGRVTSVMDWGMLGLVKERKGAAAQK